MFVKTRCKPENIEYLDIYVELVSDILHMEAPEILFDEEGLLEEDVKMRIMIFEDGNKYILLHDILDIHDEFEAVCVYYMMSVYLYYYCELLDGCTFVSSIATDGKDTVGGIMDEDEWSDLNAHAFAYLCAKDFFGATVSFGERADIIAERAEEMREVFNKYTLDAYFKSFSDIIGR